MLTIRTIVASPGGGHRPAAGPFIDDDDKEHAYEPGDSDVRHVARRHFRASGAMAWGHGAQGESAAQAPATPAAIEDALATAVKDPDRVTALLDELSRGRLWLPLPDASPVTDGSAVLLPTVT